MTQPDWFACIDATWPAAELIRHDGWTLRRGAGGGSRVSSATWDGAGDPTDIATAEAGMRRLGQTPQFMIRTADTALDAALDARGYAIKDPVTLFAMSAAQLAAVPPPVSCFETIPPLAIQAEIWAEGGIGPERLAIMARPEGPRITLFGRIKDRPAGAAFVASHSSVAMLHALEILSPYRRQGLGKIMMQAAADWAVRQGADWIALLVTKANGPANGLYTSLGFQPVGHYHYRIEA